MGRAIRKNPSTTTTRTTLKAIRTLRSTCEGALAAAPPEPDPAPCCTSSTNILRGQLVGILPGQPWDEKENRERDHADHDEQKDRDDQSADNESNHLIQRRHPAAPCRRAPGRSPAFATLGGLLPAEGCVVVHAVVEMDKYVCHVRIPVQQRLRVNTRHDDGLRHDLAVYLW